MTKPTHEHPSGFASDLNEPGRLAYACSLLLPIYPAVNRSDSPAALRVLCTGPPPREGSGIAAFHECLTRELALNAELSDTPLRTSFRSADEQDALHVFDPRTWARFVSRVISGKHDAILLTQWMPLTLPAYLSIVLASRAASVCLPAFALAHFSAPPRRTSRSLVARCERAHAHAPPSGRRRDGSHA